ncbi:hypothetical protein [Marinoscillum furvescens]|uniref:Uncharacterized protein n=1 Tax=Marinoscillum furvescens DSM 4134 TaxID=1122208 RepID=A0A3D9L5B1_MARFU|nr:hypothetical protein [Marinoscillum furvescens]REE01099.1 hypothetical protein C7460_104119 [Marinoscillum furvescens DSM 4134]
MIDTTSHYQFLTTRPQRRMISKNHPEFLYILPHQTVTSPKLVAVVTYTDNTSEKHELLATTLRAGETRMYDISYAKRNYDMLNPAKTIRKFIIRVDSPDYPDGTEDYIECYPYTPTGDHIRAIYYHNSQGGVDSLICVGDEQEQIQANGIITAQPFEAVYESASQQFRYADPKFRTQHSLSSAAKPGKEVFALKDLFLIKQAYEYHKHDTVVTRAPIIPEQEQLILPSAKSNIKRLAITYRYAFEQRAMDRVI